MQHGLHPGHRHPLRRQAKYDQAVTYFKSGAGNGSINHAVPFLHSPARLGQWQESGRDQGAHRHGHGPDGAICEMAWNQGDDLYGYADKRFLAVPSTSLATPT